jgi:alcohol dehydrogenase YqhD (iron-dependent ADH family)
MPEFTFQGAKKIVFGEGVINKVADEIHALGGKKVLTRPLRRWALPRRSPC